MKKKVIIFLNRKLLTADTILPFLIEIKEYNRNIKKEVWIPDDQTFKEIKKNIFLYKELSLICKIKVLSNKNRFKIFQFIHKMKVLCDFFLLLFQSLFTKVIFIHFKLLLNWPFRTLLYLNYNNTYFAEANSYGDNLSMASIKDQSWPLLKNYKFPGKLIQFSKDWYLVNYSKTKKSHIFYYGFPRTTYNFVNLIEKKKKNFF